METKLTIAETITKLEAGFGSIYSKDDVLNLLNNLKIDNGNNDITEVKIRDFCDKIKSNILDNSDIVDTDSIELSIGYNNQIEIDNVPLYESELDRIFDYEIEEFIEDNFKIDNSKEKSQEDREDKIEQ